MDYNSNRSRNLFHVNELKPYKLSRSKIQNFLDCTRCFFLDRKCGTGRPPSYPFTLNNAVDALLKREFNRYREQGKVHPLCLQHGIDAVPFDHPDLDEWRMNLKGIQYHHGPTNFIITGSVDDVWVKPNGELIVVDYKATSTTKAITLDEEYRQAYKRQMEIYQWLLRRNGFQVSKTGYFVYCNGDSQKEDLSGKLEFSISVIPYIGDDSWVEPTLLEIRECLEADKIPSPTDECDFCQYWAAVKKHIDNEGIVNG